MNVQAMSTAHIELRPNRAGQTRAHVAGTRVRVQDIVSDHERHGLSPEQIAREYPQVTLAQVHAALAYYYDHRDEILEQIKTDEDYVRKVEEEQRKSVSSQADTDAHADSVSS